MAKTEFSAENLLSLAGVDEEKWGKTATDEELEKTKLSLEKNGIKAIIVDSEDEALQTIQQIIPQGAEVMNGTSTTLAEIGFVDCLKEGGHGWKNLHAQVLAEKDGARQSDLRRKALLAEYFVASANAVSQTGEIFACDASGSRTGAFLFAAKNLVIVVGANKIVPTFNDGLERIRSVAFPLENERAKKAYGMPSRMGKFAILAGEYGPRTTVILVRKKLGY